MSIVDNVNVLQLPSDPFYTAKNWLTVERVFNSISSTVQLNKLISLEITFFNKSHVNVILPALDNDENMKDNIQYVIFCNLLVIRGCVGSCNSFEISGWLLHSGGFRQSIKRLHCPNSYYRNTTSELGAPHNKRNRKQRIENKNFNLLETVYSAIHGFW